MRHSCMLFRQDTKGVPAASISLEKLREKGKEDTYHITASATVIVIASEVGAGAVALWFATIGANASTS